VSATNRGGEREKDDNYPTPSWPVVRFLEKLPADIPLGGKWLEPCAGDGAIIQTINDTCLDNDCDAPEWSAIELRVLALPALTEVVDPSEIVIGDFLEVTSGAFDPGMSRDRWDVIISNPPYSIAMEVIERSFQMARFVIMLLRVGFLESDERVEWVKAHTPDIFVLPNRPQFVNGRTDNCAYAWMVWRTDEPRSVGTLTILDSTPLAVRKLKGKP